MKTLRANCRKVKPLTSAKILLSFCKAHKLSSDKTKKKELILGKLTAS